MADIVQQVGNVYSDLARQYGCDPKAGGYHDRPGRDVRYGKLAEIFELDRPAGMFTVAELGCGYGAFFDYLNELLPGRISHYYGYDVSDEMLALGRVHLNNRPATLMRTSNIAEPADYNFISGIFNVRLSASEAEWQTYIENTLRHSFKMARRGLAFYAFTNAVDYRNEKFHYSDPIALAEFCRRNLSPLVHVAQGYGCYEFTMIVLR